MIIAATDHGVTVVTMDRADRRNALSVQSMVDLDVVLKTAATDDAVGAVVVCGANGHFTAGADFKELAGYDSSRLGSHPFHALIETLALFPKPIVAGVTGDAVGFGTTMLLHFDFVIAATDARFRAPFVALGVTAEGASSLLLERVVGPRVAARMLLAAEWVEAEEAAACGLVTRLAPAEMAVSEATALARHLAGLDRDSVMATKQLMVEGRRSATLSALANERQAALALYSRHAYQAALESFRTGP